MGYLNDETEKLDEMFKESHQKEKILTNILDNLKSQLDEAKSKTIKYEFWIRVMIRAQTKLGKPLLDISRFKEAIKALELEAKKIILLKEKLHQCYQNISHIRVNHTEYAEMVASIHKLYILIVEASR